MSSLRRSGKPMRRSWIKRATPKRREPTPPGWQSYQGLCPRCHHHVGRVDAHHVVPKQTLRKRGLDAHLWDDRNRFWLGECCHTATTNHSSKRLRRDELPGRCFEFARDFGLMDVLDRVYPEDSCGLCGALAGAACPSEPCGRAA